MSASKRRGTAFETAVVNFLKDHGFPYVERRALSGINDKGDVAGIPGVVLELKDHRQIDLAGFVDEAEREAANAGVDIFAAVVKRRGKNVSEAYAVMPLRKLAELLRDAEWKPHPEVQS